MIEPAVFVPAIAVAHVLGVILLLYSVEKVSGVLSKLGRRLRARPKRTVSQATRQREASIALGTTPNGKIQNVDENVDAEYSTSGCSADDDASQVPSNHDWDSSADARARTGIVNEREPHVLTAPWIRGCKCIVRLHTDYLRVGCHLMYSK
jgi:hypothetical protein